MKKKTFFLSSKLWCLGAFALSMLAVSCAQDGFDDETFRTDVHNTELTSPAEKDISIESSSDGSLWIISWPVVTGAKEYDCQVYDTTTGDDIVLVDSIVDGVSFTVNREEDSNYRFVIRTIADETKGNTSPEASTTKMFSSFVPSFATIESGKDLAEYISGVTFPEDSEDEIVFDLQAGGTYTVNSGVDIGYRKVTFRCQNPNNRPIIAVNGEGNFVIQAGFTLKNLLLDCTDMTSGGLIALSKEPDAKVPLNQDVYTAAQTTNLYLLSDPVMIRNCMIKNLPKALFTNNGSAWAVVSLNVLDNIIQLNNDKTTFIRLDDGSGALKNLNIKNNTIYNLQESNSAYFIRFNNASNALKTWGSNNEKEKDRFVSDISNNTIMRTFTNKDFANNIPTDACFTNIMTNNIFIDVFRLSKYIISQHVKTIERNTIWGIVTTLDGTDKSTYCTEEDPGFVPPTEPLDLTKENGGLSLTPTGANASAWRSGDPRWLP